jgi:outer membrane protein assembly factor BamD
MIQRTVLASALVCLCLLACSGSASKVEVAPEDRAARADRLAAEGECRKAVLEYEELLSQFPPPDVAERARFNRTRCRVKLEDYDLAINEFEDFIDSYPKSDLIDDAMYMIAVCYLAQSPRAERDQRNTVKALNELDFVLREYPDSNVREEAEASRREARGKLARKEYLNGKLYLRLGHFRAARVCFDIVINDYGDTEWAAWSMLGNGQAYDREGNVKKAVEIYEKIIAGYPGTEPSGRAGMRLDRISGGGGDEKPE